jgi:hypothetical protein
MLKLQQSRKIPEKPPKYTSERVQIWNLLVRPGATEASGDQPVPSLFASWNQLKHAKCPELKTEYLPERMCPQAMLRISVDL